MLFLHDLKIKLLARPYCKFLVWKGGIIKSLLINFNCNEREKASRFACKWKVFGCCLRAHALRIETGCFRAQISNIYRNQYARLYKHTRSRPPPFGRRAACNLHQQRVFSFTLARINYQSWANSIQYLAFSTRQCKALSPGYWARSMKKFSKYVIPCSGIAQSHLYAPLPIQRRRHHTHTAPSICAFHPGQFSVAQLSQQFCATLEWPPLMLCTYATLSNTSRASSNFHTFQCTKFAVRYLHFEKSEK